MTTIVLNEPVEMLLGGWVATSAQLDSAGSPIAVIFLERKGEEAAQARFDIDKQVFLDSFCAERPKGRQRVIAERLNRERYILLTEGCRRTSTMTYESSPQARLLATHCAACGRPLCDSVSVDIGMGPICRQKFGLLDAWHTEEARKEANVIVYKIALSQLEMEFIDGSKQLRALGFDRLADKIYTRSQQWKAEQEVEQQRLRFGVPAVIATPEMLEDAEPSILIEEERGFYYVRTPYIADSTPAWRAIPGRRWSAERKANAIPTTSRHELWALFQTFYAGELASGPKGTFVIPGCKVPF